MASQYGSPHRRTPNRTVDEAEVLGLRKSQAAEVMSILEVSLTHAESLLRGSCWDVEAAILKELDSGQGDTIPPPVCTSSSPDDPSTPHAQASGSEPSNSCNDTAGSSSPSRVADRAWKRVHDCSTVTCRVCFDDGPSEAFETDCGSQICRICWRMYLRTMIQSGGSVVMCPMPKCSTVVSGELVSLLLSTDAESAGPAGAGVGAEREETVSEGATDAAAEVEKSDKEMLRMYRSFQVQDFIQGSPDFRNCPGKGCGAIVRRARLDDLSAQCELCQTTFCFKCSMEDHWPVDCKSAKEWCVRVASCEYTSRATVFVYIIRVIFYADSGLVSDPWVARSTDPTCALLAVSGFWSPAKMLKICGG